MTRPLVSRIHANVTATRTLGNPPAGEVHYSQMIASLTQMKRHAVCSPIKFSANAPDISGSDLALEKGRGLIIARARRISVLHT